MSDLADTKKKLGQTIKTHLQALRLPGELSKKVSTKMRLEAKLDSGTDVVLACAEVKGGRQPGTYGLYWLVSITGGPILTAMEATGLAESPTVHGPLVYAETSHSLPIPSHYEVSSGADFDAVGSAIANDMREHAFPIIESFNSKPDQALDYILKHGPGLLRNPFTACVILMHLAKRTERLDEIVKAASAGQGFYDFKGDAEARTNIVEPLAKWFKSRH